MSKKSQRHAEAARREREARRIKRVQPRTELLEPKLDTETTKPTLLPQILPGLRKRFFPGFLALMTTLGGAYVLYDLRPKVQISKAESLDDSNAFETQFTITNSSALFGLNNVEAYCQINKVIAGVTFGLDRVLVQDRAVVKLKLAPTESVTVPCSLNRVVNTEPVTYADVFIMAAYDYPLWWRRLASGTRFITKAKANGQLLWFPQSLNSN
jgi:hypothetical protein